MRGQWSCGSPQSVRAGPGCALRRRSGRGRLQSGAVAGRVGLQRCGDLARRDRPVVRGRRGRNRDWRPPPGQTAEQPDRSADGARRRRVVPGGLGRARDPLTAGVLGGSRDVRRVARGRRPCTARLPERPARIAACSLCGRRRILRDGRRARPCARAVLRPRHAGLHRLRRELVAGLRPPGPGAPTRLRGGGRRPCLDHRHHPAGVLASGTVQHGTATGHRLGVAGRTDGAGRGGVVLRERTRPGAAGHHGAGPAPVAGPSRRVGRRLCGRRLGLAALPP